jgi:hypothetical protein
MSYDRDSEYVRSRDDRTRIRNLVGYGRETSRDFPRCPFCLEKWRLEIVNSEDGTKKMGKCIRGCGQLFDLETMRNDETGSTMLVPTKYTSKYGSTGTSHSFIASQGDKNKKRKQTGSINDQLTKEDRDDIRKSLGAEPN